MSSNVTLLSQKTLPNSSIIPDVALLFCHPFTFAISFVPSCLVHNCFDQKHQLAEVPSQRRLSLPQSSCTPQITLPSLNCLLNGLIH